MSNYSIGYLDSEGRTEGSQLLPFDDNKAAIDYARIGVVRNAVVEVWKDNDLVTRLYRDAPQPNLPGVNPAENAVLALDRAHPKAGLEDWDNEGGAGKPQPRPTLQ